MARSVAIDVLTVLASYLGAMLFRFQGEVPSFLWRGFIWFSLLAALAYAFVAMLWQTYSGQGAVFRTALAGVVVSAFLVWLEVVMDSLPIPPTVLVLGAAGSTLGVVAVRIVWTRRPGMT